MAEAVDRGDAGAEGDRVHHRACQSKVCWRVAHAAGKRKPSAERGEPDRHVDREQTTARSQPRGSPDATVGPTAEEIATTIGVDADAAAELLARIDDAHERGVDAHDAGRAETLDDARDRQRRQRVRQRAGQRGDGEQREPGQVDAAIADAVAERGKRQQRDGDRELIGVDDPDRVGRAGIEVLAMVGSATLAMAPSSTASVRPSAIEDRPIAPRDGQAVGMFDWSGGHRLDRRWNTCC